MGNKPPSQLYILIICALFTLTTVGCQNGGLGLGLSKITGSDNGKGDKDVLDEDLPNGDNPNGDDPNGDNPDGDNPNGDDPDGDNPMGDNPDPDGDSCTATYCQMECQSTGHGGLCQGSECHCYTGDECTPGDFASCYTGPSNTAGVGRCRAGSRRCPSNGQMSGSVSCVGQVHPAAETCNSIDDDCDGVVDESCVPQQVNDADNPCTPGTFCTADGQASVCVRFPSGRTGCGDTPPCDPANQNQDCPVSGNTGLGAPERMECTQYPDGLYRCYDPPQTTCSTHYWYDEISGGQGRHFDTCMPQCIYNPAAFTTCTSTVVDGDLVMTCDWARSAEGWRQPYNRSFLALSQPAHNPREFKQCLFAWGVHPLTRLERIGSGANRRARSTLRILEGSGGMTSLTRQGLTTRLPASAFQQTHIDRLPLTSTQVPDIRSERGARVFWNESSSATIRSSTMQYPYETCSSCQTYDDLIDHMYPGPEVFCQGLNRDPADSQFVVPVWLPFYEAQYQTQNLAIVSEMVCENFNGTKYRTVSVQPLPGDAPSSYPTNYD